MYLTLYHGRFGLLTWQSMSHWKNFTGSYWYHFERDVGIGFYLRFCGFELTFVK